MKKIALLIAMLFTFLPTAGAKATLKHINISDSGYINFTYTSKADPIIKIPITKNAKGDDIFTSSHNYSITIPTKPKITIQDNIGEKVIYGCGVKREGVLISRNTYGSGATISIKSALGVISTISEKEECVFFPNEMSQTPVATLRQIRRGKSKNITIFKREIHPVTGVSYVLDIDTGRMDGYLTIQNDSREPWRNVTVSYSYNTTPQRIAPYPRYTGVSMMKSSISPMDESVVEEGMNIDISSMGSPQKISVKNPMTIPGKASVTIPAFSVSGDIAIIPGARATDIKSKTYALISPKTNIPSGRIDVFMNDDILNKNTIPYIKAGANHLMPVNNENDLNTSIHKKTISFNAKLSRGTKGTIQLSFRATLKYGIEFDNDDNIKKFVFLTGETKASHGDWHAKNGKVLYTDTGEVAIIIPTTNTTITETKDFEFNFSSPSPYSAPTPYDRRIHYSNIENRVGDIFASIGDTGAAAIIEKYCSENDNFISTEKLLASRCLTNALKKINGRKTSHD